MQKYPLSITLDEASNFTFRLGSARMSPLFKEKLRDEVLTIISKYFEKYDINVIEVIGHTDGVPVINRLRNSKIIATESGKIIKTKMDEILQNFSFSSDSQDLIEQLGAKSNTDLGLIRALSVANFIRETIKNGDYPYLKNVKLRVYSASQLMRPYSNQIRGADNKPNSKRRRIELRLTKQKLK